MAFNPTDPNNSSAAYQIWQRATGGQGKGNANWGNAANQLGGVEDQFASTFKNMTGQDPTAQDINKFFAGPGTQATSTGPGLGGSTYTDWQNLVNAYMPTNYGQQMQDFSRQQQEKALTDTQGQLGTLVNEEIGGVTKQLGDPHSQMYRGLAGSMNNLGITPGSGAFQQGAGSILGQSASNAINHGLESVTFPALQGIQGMSAQPYNNAMQNQGTGLQNYGNNATNYNDFQMQSQLAQQLAQDAQPSGLQNAIGDTSALLQGIGSVTGGGASKATSYVCLELIRRGIAWGSDLDLLHYAVLPAVFKKARAFWLYATRGKALVQAANDGGIDWRKWRFRLLDNVVYKHDPVKAVDAYSEAIRELCLTYAPHLWDERALRTGYWDSLRFLPLILTYPPYLKAAKKVLKMRSMFLLDLPLSPNLDR